MLHLWYGAYSGFVVQLFGFNKFRSCFIKELACNEIPQHFKSKGNQFYFESFLAMLCFIILRLGSFVVCLSVYCWS